MNDLIAFLNARLDEDEAAAHPGPPGLRRRRLVEGGRHIIRIHRLHEDGPCDTLRSLAAIYGKHPDYRREWAP